MSGSADPACSLQPAKEAIVATKNAVNPDANDYFELQTSEERSDLHGAAAVTPYTLHDRTNVIFLPPITSTSSLFFRYLSSHRPQKDNWALEAAHTHGIR